jgi:hypothetical protein
MATKKKKIRKATRPAKKPDTRPVNDRSGHEKFLRDHVLYLLNGGGAHAAFDAAVDDWPVQLAGAKVATFPHSAWMLLEHMRIAQWDILEFSRNAKHVSPAWPEGYWPASEAPANNKAWKASMTGFKKDMRTMARLVANRKTNLYARIPWGDGQTILREALLLADHNAYHLGQLVMLRKSMGI